VVGNYKSAQVLYVAKVRNGFVHTFDRRFGRSLADWKQTGARLGIYLRKNDMWALNAEKMKKSCSVKSELVAQIDFTEWRPENRLRHSTLLVLRDDKNPYVDATKIPNCGYCS
jgi:ATP-dependent DNA ligase